MTVRPVLLICLATAILPIARSVQADRPKARAEMSAEERLAHIAKLRQQYAGPPETWPEPTIDDGVDWKPLGKIPKIVHPEGNRGTKEKIELGEQLFFDPRLSGSKQIACASCHDPDLGWGDGRTVSFGHDRTVLKRNAPSIMNSAFRETYFWDGRADSLEQQAGDVLNNAAEMHSSDTVVVENLADIDGYQSQFEGVFGPNGLTAENAIKAIAAFERTIVGGRSRFDYFLNGKSKALSDEGLAGLHLFRTNGRCMNCHHGPLMTDDKFHNLGLSNYGRRFEDLGRYEITKDPADVGKFRTPSLRNVMNNDPYMHGGMFSLDELLVLYNAGMRTLRPRKNQRDDPLFPVKSPLLKELNFNQRDFDDLKAFLSLLSEPHVRVVPPDLPGMHQWGPAARRH